MFINYWVQGKGEIDSAWIHPNLQDFGFDSIEFMGF